MEYGVKLASGLVYGPYSRREARRVAKTLEGPHEIVVLVDGIEDPVLSRRLVRKNFFWTPIALAFQFLIISVYFGQGPAVLATLVLSPRAYDAIPKAADLPQTADAFSVLERAHAEDTEVLLKAKHWVAGILGMVFFLASAAMGVWAYRLAEQRWNPACVALAILWVLVTVAALKDAPNGVLGSGGWMRLFS